MLMECKRKHGKLSCSGGYMVSLRVGPWVTPCGSQGPGLSYGVCGPAPVNRR